MNHDDFLVALKKALKARGLTYGMLSEHLGISEASVKRVFSQGTLTLERIGAILDWAGLSFLDVARIMDNRSDDLRLELSLEQEEVLAKNSLLCSFFHMLLFGRTIRALRKDQVFDGEAIERFKAALLSLGLAEKAPQGELKLTVGRGVKWIADGPMSRSYGRALKREFLEGDFSGSTAVNRFMTRGLTKASQAAAIKKIKALMDEIDSMALNDDVLEESETEPQAFFIATRPFTFSFRA